MQIRGSGGRGSIKYPLWGTPYEVGQSGHLPGIVSLFCMVARCSIVSGVFISPLVVRMGKMSRMGNFSIFAFFSKIFLDKPPWAEYTEIVNSWLLLGGGHILICSLCCSAGGICREANLFEKYGVAMFVNQGHESLVFLVWFIAAAVGIVEMTMSDVVVCGVPVFRRPERLRLCVTRSH